MRLFYLFLVSLVVVTFFVDHCSCLSVENHRRRAFRSKVFPDGTEKVSPPLPGSAEVSLPCRRRWLWLIATGSGMVVNTWAVNPMAAMARYVLDEETGDYVEVDETDWQSAWKERLDKASSMSMDEIVQAARGAGNVELKAGIESDASKKRRAMSACRDTSARQKANAGTEKDCTARVFSGEVDFMLDVL